MLVRMPDKARFVYTNSYLFPSMKKFNANSSEDKKHEALKAKPLCASRRWVGESKRYLYKCAQDRYKTFQNVLFVWEFHRALVLLGAQTAGMPCALNAL